MQEKHFLHVKLNLLMIYNCTVVACLVKMAECLGLSVNFESCATLTFRPKTNLLICKVLKKDNLTHNIKGPSNMVSCNRCYGLQPLMMNIQPFQPHASPGTHLYTVYHILTRYFCPCIELATSCVTLPLKSRRTLPPI